MVLNPPENKKYISSAGGGGGGAWKCFISNSNHRRQKSVVDNEPACSAGEDEGGDEPDTVRQRDRAKSQNKAAISVSIRLKHGSMKNRCRQKDRLNKMRRRGMTEGATQIRFSTTCQIRSPFLPNTAVRKKQTT